MAILGRIELFVALLTALLLTGAREARADTPRPSLVVTRSSGAEDCPDAAGVMTRSMAIMRLNPFELPPGVAPDTWVQVEFLRELSGYRAVISARGRRHGLRSIDDIGPHCASLADAVAITLVMLLDPEVTRPHTEPVPAASPPRAPPDRAPVRAPPPPRVRFGAEASGGAALGVLANGVPFLEAGATLRVDRWLLLGVGGGFVFPDRASTPSGSVALDLWYGYLRATARIFESAATQLALFAGPSTGSLGGEGVDYALHPDQRLWWIAAVLGLELRGALSSSFSWTGRIFALLPLRRDEFYVIDAGTEYPAFRTPSIGGALSLGIAGEL